MKYINAEKLKSEIERRMKFHDDAMKVCVGLTNIALTHGAGWKEDNELLSFIDSLQQEQKEVDIEKEIDELWEGLNTGHDYVIVDSYQCFLGICLHCFELGLNARKEDKM